MILSRFKKHASLLMCLFLLQLLHSISLFGCMLCLFDHHIPYESVAFAFLETGESIGKARRCSKGSADCERHQGDLVPPVFAVKAFKKLMDIYCLLAYCNCCQEQIDAFQPYLPIAASLPSFSNVETFQCIIAHS